MSRALYFRLHAALIVSFASQVVFAQSSGSTFSIPNPIIKPSSIAAGTDVAVRRTGAPQGGQSSGPPGGMPSVRSDPQSGSRESVIPPLPEAISQASLPGQRSSVSAPGSDAIVRDTLATFTVTAIVGNRAVLRNNVGGFTYAPTAQGTGQAPGGDSSLTNRPANGATSQSPLQRQAVIRVKSNVSVFVAGIELVPEVLESRVEFRMTGKRQVMATVMLESQSSYGYVPATNTREAADPAVQQRVAPKTATGLTGSASFGSQSPAPGAPLGSNGQLPTQR